MDILDTLFYKADEITGERRIAKTKTISISVFLLIFLFFMYLYLTDPELAGGDIIISLFASIIIGLICAVPVFVIGWILGRLLNYRNPLANNPQGNYNQQTNNPNNVYQGPQLDYVPSKIQDSNAKKFKKAIEENDSDLAQDLLSSWDRNDANYMYAKVIFEGMPPSSVGVDELRSWLEKANTMIPSDETLKFWYKSSAEEVINLNNENN